MNHLEFKVFSKVLDFLKPTNCCVMNQKNYPETVYQWNQFYLYFSGYSYCILKGPVPLALAQKVHDKYPENPYLIRVLGGCPKWNPKDYAVDGLIEFYHIDTKEGLLIFMTELRNYILNGQEVISLEIQQKDLLLKAHLHLIRCCHPYFTSDHWMIENHATRLFRTKNRAWGHKNKKIRSLLNEFDKMVNPLGSIYIKSFSCFNTLSFDYDSNLYSVFSQEEFESSITITDKETKSFVSYKRTASSLTYFFKLYTQGSIYEITHKYLLSNADYHQHQSEKFRLHCINTEFSQLIDRSYHLTIGFAGKTYHRKHFMLGYDKDLLIDELTELLPIVKRLFWDKMI